MNGFRDMVGFIWQVAGLLRGDYKQSEYGKVILPLTVLRRLDCVLDPTKPAVLAKVKQLGGRITRPDDAGLLYPVVARFADIDRHPDQVSNLAMGYVFEDLIRRFSEISNETAGEHFTPREGPAG